MSQLAAGLAPPFVRECCPQAGAIWPTGCTMAGRIHLEANRPVTMIVPRLRG